MGESAVAKMPFILEISALDVPPTKLSTPPNKLPLLGW